MKKRNKMKSEDSRKKETERSSPAESQSQSSSLYIGDRGSEFQTRIRELFQKAGLKQKYVNALMKKESLVEFGKAFTASSANQTDNYEVYEQRGDAALGHFMVTYFYDDRFKYLNCSEGVKVVARLKINYGSKNNLCKIAEDMGFWPFISASMEDRNRKMKKLLEDTFEAFIGCVEFILDTQFMRGVGYAKVYEVMVSIFDKIPMSLSYTSLYDAKTRLKQLVDLNREKIGELVYKEDRKDLIVISRVYSRGGVMWPSTFQKYHNRRGVRGGDNDEGEFLGQGSAGLKADAQQKASEQAIAHLARNGIKETIPPIYNFFNTDSKRAL
jgi:dsRNA-specific ribonuclease